MCKTTFAITPLSLSSGGSVKFGNSDSGGGPQTRPRDHSKMAYPNFDYLPYPKSPLLPYCRLASVVYVLPVLVNVSTSLPEPSLTTEHRRLTICLYQAQTIIQTARDLSKTRSDILSRQFPSTIVFQDTPAARQSPNITSTPVQTNSTLSSTHLTFVPPTKPLGQNVLQIPLQRLQTGEIRLLQ